MLANYSHTYYNKERSSNMEKAFEELQIKDDFMFSVIMRNPKLCKPFLERILGIKIRRIEYPKSQETIDLSADAKSAVFKIWDCVSAMKPQKSF